MKAGFPIFQKEHEKIRSLIQELETAWKAKNLPSCQNLLQALNPALREHHSHEKHQLFDLVRARHQMREGGPFCSYFFDFYMNNRPQRRVEKLLTLSRGEDVTLAVPEDLKIYFNEQSLFCIPLEEHLSMQALAQELQKVLSLSNPSNDWIEKSLSYLKDLIQLNFQKEETCLWEAISEIKDPVLQEQLQICRSQAG